ncbi:MAG: hypothetical protein WC349_04600 [Patescibacteria group bacterium]|jgi:hypothetical protein
MKKYLYTILIILLITIIAFLVIYFIKNPNKMIISTAKEKIKINNIYKNSIEKFDSGVEFKKNPDYLIDYYAPDQSFIIVITNPNIAEIRKKAEKDFLDTLNINQEQACKLTISVGVPFSVNENAAGINYGLSFCPDGKPL